MFKPPLVHRKAGKSSLELFDEVCEKRGVFWVFGDFGWVFVGNGPNTVSESTVSDTELSEFFGAH